MTKKSTNKSNSTSTAKSNSKLTNRLLGLPPEVIITGQVPHPYAVIITISFPEPEERVCPHCGSLHCVIKGGSPRYPGDFSIFFGVSPTYPGALLFFLVTPSSSYLFW